MIDKLQAQDIMIQEVQVTSPHALVAAAKLKMTRCNVGGLPVVDEKKLVGIITHRDILLAGREALGLRHLPPYSIAVGVPARVTRTRVASRRTEQNP